MAKPRKAKPSADVDGPRRPHTTQVRADGGCRGLLGPLSFLPPGFDFNLPPRELLELVRKHGRPFDWRWDRLRPVRQPCGATWNSVLLFHNLAASVGLPNDYVATAAADAREFLDEGANPAQPTTIGEFMRRYWCALSYGRLAFKIDTPRDDERAPIVPTLTPAGGAGAWEEMIQLFVTAHGERIWRAAGSPLLDGRRWIPSVVLVQRYLVGLSARFGPATIVSGGVEYVVGDRHHMHYNLAWSGGGAPADGRMIWGRMCHEYAHNFLEFGDLYSASGCTGYWDLFGDASPTRSMSEVCSHMKERLGWIQYRHVIEGPMFPATAFSLRPYTTTGDAIKVVPDPENNPQEFFLLEYRRSTGNEVWRPDGGLTEEGLLILHINTRMLQNGNTLTVTSLLRDAPFFDPEPADFGDNGGTQWTGFDRHQGVLYPQGPNDRFTPATTPDSNFYGRRPSGLHVTDIQVAGGTVNFNLRLAGDPRRGWTVGAADRGLPGHFIDDPLAGREQVFFRNDDAAALLVARQAQWLVESRQDDWIGEWNLGADNYEVVGDLDGDGFDEVYIRSPNWAGVLKYEAPRFRAMTVQFDWVADWNLGPTDRELALDVDGDNADEIFIRSPEWAGLLHLVDGRLRLLWIQYDWIDEWNLGPGDRHYSGRFTQAQRDEVLIVSGEWIGVLAWNPGQGRLRLVSLQHDWIDEWNLGPGDRHTIADLDGDGLDEIYVRSDRWAGVFKWRGDRFALTWIARLAVTPLDGTPNVQADLAAGDRSYAVRAFPDRQGILHRSAASVSVFRWDGARLGVHRFDRGGLVYRSRFEGMWNLGANDRFVVGQFPRGGPDIANIANTVIAPGQSGVLIHNAWGTGNLGANHQNNQISLTWIQREYLMFAR
jgi:hypothetical protein